MWSRDVPRDEKLSDVLLEHLRFGYVISTPEMFLMFRAVKYVNGGIDYNGEPNCWYVTAAATADGTARSIAKLFMHMPYPLPLCAWMRRGQERVRAYRTESLLNKA